MGSGTEEVAVGGSGLSTASGASLGQRRFLAEYALGPELGYGSFGAVRVATHTATKRVWAVKILDTRGREVSGKPGPVDPQRVEAAKSELRVWQLLAAHINVVALHDAFVNGIFFYFVMERCGGDLLETITQRGDISEAMVTVFFRGMLQGLAHVHSAGVVHRDIKPANFLLAVDGATVKLCDFGLAVCLPPGGVVAGAFGTAPYMSPEMLLGRPYGTSTDIWSFGTVAYLVMHGDFPYKSADKTNAGMKKAIARASAPIVFERPATAELYFGAAATNRAAPFLRPLLRRDPEHRVSAREALHLPFVAPPPEGRPCAADVPCGAGRGKPQQADDAEASAASTSAPASPAACLAGAGAWAAAASEGGGSGSGGGSGGRI